MGPSKWLLICFTLGLCTLAFTAVIMGRGPGGLDGQALLREIEEYLKELAGAAKSEGVKTFTENRSENGKEIVVQWIRFGRNEISTYDREIQGKKVGFVFRYRTPAEVHGEIVVDLYNERTTTQGAIWGLVAVSMDVRE